MGFAVHKSTGITSLAEIKQRKTPLRVSTGYLPKSDLAGSATMFTVAATLRAAGIFIGGHSQMGRQDSFGASTELSGPARCHRERHDQRGVRRRHQELGANGSRQRFPLSAGGRHRAQISQSARLTAERYVALRLSRHRRRSADSRFQRLAMIVRADMANEVAYALCEAIELRKQVIPLTISNRSACRSSAPMTTRRPTTYRFIPAQCVSIANAAISNS
jgi:hypothetical protein